MSPFDSLITHTAATPLTAAGSNRRYYRLFLPDGATAIGVVGTSQEENKAFITLCRHFESKRLNVPHLLAVSPDGMVYVQQDLGSLSLYDALREGRERRLYSEAELNLVRSTLALLPTFQMLGDEACDYSVCYPQPSLDEQGIMFDLNYFKYCYLKLLGADFHELRLESDFHSLAQDLLADSGQWGFMLRDFQARNVMLLNGSQPYFIDFQGGRRGPCLYDVVSFLWQASSHFPSSLRSELTAAWQPHQVNRMVLFRTLQVLGAYGYRGLYERKPHFISSIPPALDNLRSVLSAAEPYPHLHTVLTHLLEQTAQSNKETCKESGKETGSSALRVRVFSFSYKRGIPQDETGNGGGYVFDCRSTHNPGRYQPYKQLTGLDQPVISFLEQDGEITTFLESVYRLADAHVERYIQRGFTDLMFAFGCTGGQHRSVYSAQHLAEHLHAKYGVSVTLCHREQGITQQL